MSHLPVSGHACHEALAHGRLHAGHVFLDRRVGAGVGPGGHAAPAQRAQVVQKHCGVINGGVAIACMYKRLSESSSCYVMKLMHPLCSSLTTRMTVRLYLSTAQQTSEVPDNAIKY